MLKLVSTSGIKAEMLELSGYTLTLRWNNPFPRKHVFWRTGNFQESLLEVGLNAENHVLEVVKVVNIQSDWISPVEIVNFSDPQLSRQVGLPIMQWSKDKPSPRIVDESGVFAIHIADEHLSIRIGEIGEITKVLVAERTLFGFDNDNHLAAMQLINLQPEEATIIEATFQGKANPKQVD